MSYSLEYQRKWQAENREKCRAYGKKWREANREKSRAYTKAWKDNLMAQPGGWRKYHYGINFDYDALVEKQGGKCAICQCEPEKLFVDHDHTKGKTKGVRGLLCLHCNTVIGYARDNPEVLRAAADYLKPQVGRNIL